jgi:hypothetical protein
MKSHFSHLVWLGAGTAQEPKGLLAQAEQITLIEAREIACTQLKQQFQQENIQILQHLLATVHEEALFTHYNLSEYSAIQAPTGLKKLFAGLSPIHTEQITTVDITDVLRSIKLQGSDNLLVIDILDKGLSLLQSIEQQGLLSQFKYIQMQVGIQPLYAESANMAEVANFMQLQGYLLQHTTYNDPDIPWLSFELNPLWDQLQEKQNALDNLDRLLASNKQELSGAQRQLAAANLEIVSISSARDMAISQQTKLLEQLATKDAVIAAANSERDLAIAQQTKLQEQLTAKDTVIAAANSERDLAIAQQTKLQEQLTAKDTVIAAANSERDLAIAQQTKPQEQVKIKEDALAAAYSERDLAIAQQLKLQEQLKAKDIALVAANSELELALTQQNKLEEQLAVKEAELAAITSKLDLALSHQKQQLDTNNHLETQLSKTIADLSRTTKERDDQAHWNQKHKDWAESLKREIETLKKEYAEGERAQSLALKLQAKAQGDLDNLRTQYQQKIDNEHKLIELIKELQIKLQAAANYYHQLQAQHPEFILGRSPDDQSELSNQNLIDSNTTKKI